MLIPLFSTTIRGTHRSGTRPPDSMSVDGNTPSIEDSENSDESLAPWDDEGRRVDDSDDSSGNSGSESSEEDMEPC